MSDDSVNDFSANDFSAIDFEVLHAIRLRGVVGPEPLAAMTGEYPGAIAPSVERLTAEGSIFLREGRRVSGYALTEEGRATHAERLVAWSADQPIDELRRVYDAFLDHNTGLKTLCSRWQQVGTDDAARWQAIGDLEDLHALADPVFVRAGELVERFARYGGRLGQALQLVRGGDERFFTSPLVDSYHTVWFEAHEDFLLALGLDRAAEGSF